MIEASDPRLDYPSGPLPPDSPLYVSRPPIEEQAYQTLTKPGSVLRIRAPQGMGKTSLCLRLIAMAKDYGYVTARLDFRRISREMLRDENSFLKWFCVQLSYLLKTTPNLEEYWDEHVGAKISCTYYIEDYLLPAVDCPVVIWLQEVGHIFDYPQIAQEFLPLLRSWHEEAKYSDSWQQVRLILSYRTEVYTLHTVSYQSPFNVGLPLRLPYFTIAQVEQLATHYGLAPSATPIVPLYALVSGHPLLLNLAFYHARQCQDAIADFWHHFMREASTERGVYHNHLRQYWGFFSEHPTLAETWLALLDSPNAVKLDPVLAYQLEGLGLIRLEGAMATVSCALYRNYFQLYGRRYLLPESAPDAIPEAAAIAPFPSDPPDPQLYQLQQENLTLRQLAYLDPLTQLFNRGYFDQHLAEYWQNALCEGYPIAILLCDIDYFKLYNDTFGHVAGDDTLRKVAQVLKQAVNGPFYFVARYGGEEFAVVLPGADISQAVAFAEHLRSKIQNLAIPVQGEETVVDHLLHEVVTASFGAASVIPQAKYTPLDLLTVADLALYAAKRKGRNRVCAADDPDFSIVHSQLP